MSLCFVFWNLGRNFPRQHIAALVHDQQPDVLMLVEGAPEAPAGLQSLLGPEFLVHAAPNQSFVWVIRRGACRFDEHENHLHMSLASLRAPAADPLLLALVHLPSPMHYGPSDQGAYARRIVRIIHDREATAGHDRTIVVGDFNMDPFDDGMILADTFHGVMSRDIAARGQRAVLGTRYKMFYNPMWRLYANGEAPASYFYASEGHRAYFWHMFDQVLIRPALLPQFVETRTALVTRTCHGSLLTPGGRPIKEISDHLPLKFHLDLASAS